MLQPRSRGFSVFGLSPWLWLKPNRQKPRERGSNRGECPFQPALQGRASTAPRQAP